MLLEIRQLTRSRFVLIYFLMVVLGDLAAVAWVLWNQLSGTNPDFALGPAAFYSVLTVLGCLSVLVLPLFSSSRMLDRPFLNLLKLTPMSLWKIFRGKLLASGVLALLGICLTAPFLVFSTLLRGVDVLDILMWSVILVSLSQLSTQLFMFLATFRCNPSCGGVVFFFLVLGTLPFILGILGSMFYSISSGIIAQVMFSVMTYLATLGTLQFLAVVTLDPVSRNMGPEITHAVSKELL